MIQEDYVSFETAKLLKEKGFDESVNRFYETSTGQPSLVRSEYCRNSYTISYAAPTLQMAMKWLREKGIVITIDYNDDSDCEDNERYGFSVYWNSLKKVDLATYTTYEEACEAAIKYCLINLVKDE